MTILSSTGVLNIETNEVFPSDNATWDDIASYTWGAWESWTVDTDDYMLWRLDPVFFPAIQDFCLKITCQADGLVDYIVYTSTTGEFNGEETTTTITNGDTNVEGFNGIAVIVVAKVWKTIGVNKLSGITVTTTNRTIGETISDVDSSTLTGSSSSRQIPITRSYSKITDISIDAHAVTSYDVDVYVTEYPTSTTVIPRVISKSNTAPTFALIGVDNKSRDGVVDIQITGLPSQYMQGNNLLIR